MHLRQSLEIFRQLGNRHRTGFALGNLGDVRYVLGDYDGAWLYYEQCLSILRETQYARGVSLGLVVLAIVSLRLGDAEQARQYAQEALRVGVGAGDRLAQSRALWTLGHALGDLGRLDEAYEAFQRALRLWRQLGNQGETMVCLVGLAHISLAQGNLAAAQDHVEEILSHLETGSLDPTFGPFRVYLTCYRVLRASGDLRADSIVEEGYRLLQERAAKISDEGERRSFLENVEEHREIVSEWAHSQM
jgi:tetratricopeptide (TPR) repeat protein